MKKYKISFDIWGLVLFLVIMIPNFIWFMIPSSNDILRQQSNTVALDTVASVFQIMMIMAICLFKNRESVRINLKDPQIIVMMISCFLYFVTWIFYYQGIVNAVVILALCLLPCMAFLFYEINRKNMIAIVPTIVFTICHLLYVIINFIL